MRSLRARLGVTITVGVFLLTSAAATAVVYVRWREAVSALPAAVELEAFRLAEASGSGLEFRPRPKGFALMLDDEANRLARVGTVDADLFEILVADIWTATTELDLAVYTEVDTDDGYVIATGVACTDPNRCDTVIVGAIEPAFAPYARDRLDWILGPALLAGALTLLVVRWLIGRALEPVDRMRRELTAITASDLDARISAPPTGDEIERLGHTLDETIGRLGAAVAANERFVADAAHELRSPITGVRAALEVEAADGRSPLLEGAITELDRASRLVDDLLVLARRQAGGAPAMTDVDLDDIVRDVLASIAVRSPDVVIERSIEPVRVAADPDAVARVVTNLVDNAIRHGRGAVAVTVGRQGSEAVLTVDDDGPGIPEAHREEVFDRFVRLDESRARTTGGSGLGLAIVAELVADHHGTVVIDSAPDLGGARVEVRLPAQA